MMQQVKVDLTLDVLRKMTRQADAYAAESYEATHGIATEYSAFLGDEQEHEGHEGHHEQDVRTPQQVSHGDRVPPRIPGGGERLPVPRARRYRARRGLLL